MRSGSPTPRSSSTATGNISRKSAHSRQPSTMPGRARNSRAILKKLSKLDGVKWPIDMFRGYGIKTEWITYAYGPILHIVGLRSDRPETWRSAGTLDADACVEALTMMQTWVKNGWVVPQSAGTNQFYAENNPAALALGGHWFYAEAAQR